MEQFLTPGYTANYNNGEERSCLGVRADLRRLSPLPAQGAPQFPTLLEEPTTPNSEEAPNSDQPRVVAPDREQMYGQRKHRRRLPFISPSLSKNNSSRSFDSGISCLLSGESGSPSPPLTGEGDQQNGESWQGGVVRAPNNPSCSPVPASSPSSHRASFHGYSRSSPAQLPKTPVPSSSPSSKLNKPGFFSSRRLSEHNSIVVADSNLSPSRTLSPISVSPHNPVAKSPSPSRLRFSLSLEGSTLPLCGRAGSCSS